MIDPKIFDDLIKRLQDAVSPTVKTVQKDLEKNFRSILQSTFAKLDLVTRKEFDTQARVLARTRAKLEELEKQVAKLESKQKVVKKTNK